MPTSGRAGARLRPSPTSARFIAIFPRCRGSARHLSPGPRVHCGARARERRSTAERPRENSKKVKQNKKPVRGKAKFASHRTRAEASFLPLPKLLKQLWRRPPGKREAAERERRRLLPSGVWPTRQPRDGGGEGESREGRLARTFAVLCASRWVRGAPAVCRG